MIRFALLYHQLFHQFTVKFTGLHLISLVHCLGECEEQRRKSPITLLREALISFVLSWDLIVYIWRLSVAFCCVCWWGITTESLMTFLRSRFDLCLVLLNCWTFQNNDPRIPPLLAPQLLVVLLEHFWPLYVNFQSIQNGLHLVQEGNWALIGRWICIVEHANHALVLLDLLFIRLFLFALWLLQSLLVAFIVTVFLWLVSKHVEAHITLLINIFIIQLLWTANNYVLFEDQCKFSLKAAFRARHELILVRGKYWCDPVLAHLLGLVVRQFHDH